MIIILEGMDGTGKTTLARKFEDLGYTFFKEDDKLKHFINFKSDPEKWEYFVTGMNAQLLNVFDNFDNFVKDRFHFSEYVFSKYTNRKSHLSFYHLEEHLIHLNKEIYLFLFQCDYDTYIERTLNKEEPYKFSKDEYDELNRKFYDAFNQSELRNQIYMDTSNKSIDEIFRKMSQEVLYGRL